ncbi:MAG: hypothetical protein COZ72_06450 [Elusimicrobia bacterium CG_4_8_14_3_um_filter_50_9]|nr:MAG: hypothetical protein COZ72_06450 [Elusimicrobia bacterium CG_4_8_14_3_um_filter_50_9]
MRNEDRNILVRHRMEKAFVFIKDAGNLFQDNSFYSCVNRIYYSVFSAVSALLLARGLYSSKHSGVMSLFHEKFVKTGIVNAKMGKFYSAIFVKRQRGDYKDLTEFKKEEVRGWLKEAEIFVKEIGKIIKDIENEDDSGI